MGRLASGRTIDSVSVDRIPNDARAGFYQPAEVCLPTRVWGAHIAPIIEFLRTVVMGKRLSQIVTRTGDDGTTGLGDGSRTQKDSLRVTALGEVDELNSVLGLLSTEDLPADVACALLDIQHDLFDLGAELCIPGYSMVTDQQVQRLDRLLEHYNSGLPRLEEFVLPGGTRAGAYAHLARTVCRRAERALVALTRAEATNAAPRQYMNRLSDLMFVLSRVLNRQGGQGETQWQQKKNAGGQRLDEPSA